MTLYITSLNSGSNGNCYYIGNDKEAILVDAGLSCRETEKRMRRLGLSIGQVKAIFVSHEHDDHIKGIPIIAKKYQLPVYITAGTLENGSLNLEDHLVHPFTAYTPTAIGSLQVTAFPKFHDAADPHSFIISQGPTVIGVFTDIGAPCDHLIRHFRQCHAAFLETNYDEDMLDKGSYPFHLKRRIRGGQGHLSNRQALELFLAHRPSFMSHLFLSHLSQNNNDPDLVQDLFAVKSDGVRIVLASRHEETAVYTIQGAPDDKPVPWVESLRAESAPRVEPGRAVESRGRRRTASGRSTPDNSSQLSLFQ
ncbi:MAG: MBL fold metallo-hydrolase [Chitinophagaceae bacterium]|nr:MBL fold metallo-hydrolase [Chitinophagaceae bacterium]